MRLETFEMERMQSLHEHGVEINLSESGVEPLSLRELLALSSDEGRALQGLLDQALAYTQTNGTEPLRAVIAAMYPGASASHVQVTTGGAEANLVSLLHLVQPGDEVVLMLPNYMQAWGLVRGLGAVVRPWWLREWPDGTGWEVDLDGLDALVGPKTRLVAVCTPNNPTGLRLTTAELAGVCDIAAKHGTWVLSDEVYRGAELDGHESPSAWGRYDRVLVTAGLSKAYGLPGLRIGWVVGPPDTIAALWAVHDYTTIAPAALSDRLARIALSDEVRPKLLARTRTIIREHYAIVRQWVAARSPALTHAAPHAGAIALVRYAHAIGSHELAELARTQRSTLVVPGSQFLLDRHLRIGFGGHPAQIRDGLDRLGQVLDTVKLAR